MEYKKYSIYKAIIQEINDVKHRFRPVLLLENDNNYKIFDIYNITHNDSNDNKLESEKNANYKYNYRIIKWQEAGLDRPSLIKIREILNIEKKCLIDKIGDLQEEDISGMEKLIEKMYDDDLKALEKYNNTLSNKIQIPNKILEQIDNKENDKEKEYNELYNELKNIYKNFPDELDKINKELDNKEIQNKINYLNNIINRYTYKNENNINNSNIPKQKS